MSTPPTLADVQRLLDAGDVKAAAKADASRTSWHAERGVTASDILEVETAREKYQGRTDADSLIETQIEMIRARRSNSRDHQGERDETVATLRAVQALPGSSMNRVPIEPDAEPTRAPIDSPTVDGAARVHAALGEVRPDHPEALRVHAASKALATLAPLPPSLHDDVLLARIAETTLHRVPRLREQLKTLRRARTKAPVATVERKAPPRKSVLPRIILGPRILDLAREGERALVAEGRELYTRGGEIARVVRDDRGSTITSCSTAYLKALLSQAADWIAPKKTHDVAVLPPRDVVDALAAKGEWPFPALEGIVAAPVLRADGTVLDQAGYDPASRLLYEPKGDYPPVPTAPTIEEAKVAVAALREPFDDFPFVAECHRSSVLALVLTILGRPAISGACPLFLVRATAAGTGKQLLVSAVGNIALGTEPVTFAAPKEDEEWAKKITTHVRSARPFVVIDEARHLDSPSLASAITLEFYSNRLLGLNEDVHGRVPVYASCGNQTTIAGDMGRRVVPIELDAQLERPEQRGGFRIPDLPAWIARERPRLVVAALTILRAYVVAGRPDQGLRELGSFGGWSRLVRNALVWAGEADPVEGQADVRAEADVGDDDACNLFRAMHKAFAGEPKTVREIVDSAIRSASTDPELRDALAAFEQRDKPLTKTLGYLLRKLARGIRGGLRLVKHDDPGETRVQRWAIVTAPSPINVATETYDFIPQHPAASREDRASHIDNQLTTVFAGSRDTSPTSREFEEEKETGGQTPHARAAPERAPGRDPSRDPANQAEDVTPQNHRDPAGSRGMLRDEVGSPDSSVRDPDYGDAIEPTNA